MLTLSRKNDKTRRLSPPSGLLLPQDFISAHSMSVTLFFCPRTTFCAMTHDEQQVEISQDKVFVRCKEDSTAQQHRRKRNRPVWVR